MHSFLHKERMTKNAKLSAFLDVASDDRDRTSSLDAIFGEPEAFATPMPERVSRPVNAPGAASGARKLLASSADNPDRGA